MRHKYRTEAFVLARHSNREADATIILATVDFGVIRARATGLRKPGSKMSIGLQTFMQTEVTLIRGKEGWRLTGALPIRNWAEELPFKSRLRAGRVCELMQRLSHGEEPEPRLYDATLALTAVLPTLDDEAQASAECLAALRVLHILGHDAGTLPGGFTDYDTQTLEQVTNDRKAYVTRVNTGIYASGL